MGVLADFWIDRPGLTPEASLRVLLQGRSGYEVRSTGANVAAFQLEAVSLPGSLGECPDAATPLPDEPRRFLEVPESMLRSSTELDAADCGVKPYSDPKLIGSRRTYLKFVRQLKSINLLRFSRKPKCHVGIFFVWKKGRLRMRMILDARVVNLLFSDPPGVKLCTSEGLARIEVEFDEDVDPESDAGIAARERLQLALGILDVENCFHRLIMPAWLSEYFGFPRSVRASEVDLAREFLDGEALHHDELIFPCARL